MKTAKEKAREIADGLPFAVMAHRAHLERSIAEALIEQDRATRHACAEAVQACEALGTPHRVRRDAAVEACLAAKAV